jgi:glutamine synthetase
MTKHQKFLDLVTEHNIEFVDFRYTDTLGKWLHITYTLDSAKDILEKGLLTDGSSVKGWKEVNDSDLLLIPDMNTVFVDPFAAQPTLIIICDVIDPKSQTQYLRDPRTLVKRALDYLTKTNIGEAFFGPELEFFIFDSVRYESSIKQSYIFVDSANDSSNDDNTGYKPGRNGGYWASAPADMSNDIRSEMLLVLKSVGLTPIMQHHEVGSTQCELGFKYGDILSTADNIQKYKFVVKNVAHSYGKTVTFMPKPLKDENGSGMHVHQSIWKDGKPKFLGDKYSKLSQDALYYIGGIIKHAKAINAFTNPTTNSYRRLVPGFEAPIYLSYSASNRSAAIRIPHVTNDSAKRIEVRFPDPAANPYLGLAAMLMAGLDGIINKIDPGAACEQNMYETEKPAHIAAISASLSESLAALDIDREFLKMGNVFSDDLIDAYIQLRTEEVKTLNASPHPQEFKMYYGV